MIHTPKSAWLKKLTITMGRPRWQSRFFVLLETEIRYYKDEFAATPNYNWSLRDIDHVRQVTMAGHDYCLSLEPIMSAPLDNGIATTTKKLILCFQSAFEMLEWQQQIASRLIRLLPCASSLSEMPSPSTSTSSTVSSSSSSSTSASSLSLSLGRRRGVILSSLDISKDHYQNTLVPTLESPTTSSASILSSTSSISTTIYYNHSSYSSLASPHNSHNHSNTDIKEVEEEDASSPTFLQYKNQFRL